MTTPDHSNPIVIDLSDSTTDLDGDLSDGCILAVHSGGSAPLSDRANEVANRATLALTTSPPQDHRFVQVSSLTNALAELSTRIQSRPLSSLVCDDILRANAHSTHTITAVTTESLAYSTLQAGPEFRQWLSGQDERALADPESPVLLERSDHQLVITLNQPRRHNTFSNSVRSGLIEALTLARLDPTIERVTLRGNGPSFCSGGDLREFGTFDNPAAAHFARTRHSPAVLLDEARSRLNGSVVAYVHGMTLGSGLEMAAFCGRVVADPETTFGLPELNLGLIPGAGGTVSIPRRIGRWRTAYLVLSGARIDANTALEWGLVDAIEPRPSWPR